MKKSLKNLILISFSPACISASGCTKGESSKDIEGISSKNTSNSLKNERSDNELSNNLSKNAGKESGKNSQKKDENGQIADRINGNKDEENLNSEFNTTSSGSSDAYIEKKSESNDVGNNRPRDNGENKEERSEGSEKIIEKSEKSKDRNLEEDLKRAIEEGEKKIIELQNRSKNTNIDNCNDDNSEVVEEDENQSNVNNSKEKKKKNSKNIKSELKKKVLQDLEDLFNIYNQEIIRINGKEWYEKFSNPTKEFLLKFKTDFRDSELNFWKHFIKEFEFLGLGKHPLLIKNTTQAYKNYKSKLDRFLSIINIIGTSKAISSFKEYYDNVLKLYLYGLTLNKHNPNYKNKTIEQQALDLEVFDKMDKERTTLESKLAQISNEEGLSL